MVQTHGDTATQARLDDASDVESRTGPQSYRAVMEAAGIIGNGVQIHNGDVNVSSQHIHLGDATLQRDPARLAELRKSLGVD